MRLDESNNDSPADPVVMIELPQCDFRTELPDGRLYCRHTKVNAARNVVPAGLCLACTRKDEPCPNPRPEPTGNIDEAPIVPIRVWNFLGALAEFVQDPGMVSAEMYQRRLAVCDRNDCGKRNGTICEHLSCGCYIPVKAKLKSQECPEKLWPYS